MTLSRREVVRGAVAALGAAVVSSTPGEAQTPKPGGARTRPANEPFGYCLNTSTIRGNKLDIVGVVAAAAKAGFHAIEPWITEIDAYTTSGGALKDLGKRIADAGLTVEGAIAFNSFLDDDDARRAASMEKLKVDMDKVAQIGGKRIAAPPGSSRAAAVSLDNAAKYYREALEMGEKMGVPPLLELWGTHPVLGPLSHGIYVTVAAGRADASLLLDVFHLYKSGTPFTALKQINGASLHLMHLNDYPQAADSVHAQRRQPDLPGRRRRAPAPDPARPARQRLPRLPLARVVQQGVLGPQRRREPEDRDGEDPRHGPRGDGLKELGSTAVHCHAAFMSTAPAACFAPSVGTTTRRHDDNDVENATGHVGTRGHFRECPRDRYQRLSPVGADVDLRPTLQE